MLFSKTASTFLTVSALSLASPALANETLTQRQKLLNYVHNYCREVKNIDNNDTLIINSPLERCILSQFSYIIGRVFDACLTLNREDDYGYFKADECGEMLDYELDSIDSYVGPYDMLDDKYTYSLDSILNDESGYSVKSILNVEWDNGGYRKDNAFIQQPGAPTQVHLYLLRNYGYEVWHQNN